MKQYFLKLFNYDHYANETMIKAIQQHGNTSEAVKLMAHLLGAQQIWLSRCRRDPDVSIKPLWPAWTSEEQLFINHQNYAAWVDFLDAMDHNQFEMFFNYQNSQGQSYANTLTDIVAHLINHGTHHRAQAGQVLINNGFGKLPVTDYIMYIRKP